MFSKCKTIISVKGYTVKLSYSKVKNRMSRIVALIPGISQRTMNAEKRPLGLAGR